MLLLLLNLPWLVYAGELDSLYYPQRIEWHNVEQLYPSDDQFNADISLFDEGDGALIELADNDSRAFINWPSGRFMRVRFESKVSEPLTLWYSRGDGLFQQLTVSEVKAGQWLFERPVNGELLMMLQKRAPRPVSLYVDFSKHTNAPRLSVNSGMVLHPDNQVVTNQSNGYQRRVYNRIMVINRWRTCWKGQLSMFGFFVTVGNKITVAHSLWHYR
jgi:hypothetical protein